MNLPRVDGYRIAGKQHLFQVLLAENQEVFKRLFMTAKKPRITRPYIGRRSGMAATLNLNIEWLHKAMN